METDDRQVWEFAKKGGFTIIANDADFDDFSSVWGFPRKIIWQHTGNTVQNV